MYSYAVNEQNSRVLSQLESGNALGGKHEVASV